MATNRPVDLHALQAFVLFCESRSMTRTAGRMGVSQSAVSQLVKALETALGESLLDRSLRPPQPTAAGRYVWERGADLLVQAHALTGDLHNGALTARTPFKLGCVGSFAATVGPGLIKALSGSKQDILMWSGLAPELHGQLLSRELDVAICTDLGPANPRITERALFSESFLLLLPDDGSDDGSSEPRALLERLPLIRYSLRSTIGSQVERYLTNLGVRAPRRYEFDATEPLLSLVSAGLGWAISTPLCLLQASTKLRSIKVRLLPGMRQSQRTFYMRAHAGEWITQQREIVRATQILFEKQVQPALRQLLPTVSADTVFPLVALPAHSHGALL